MNKVIIFGANGDIGFEITKIALKNNFYVLGTYHKDKTNLEKLKLTYKDKLEIIQLNALNEDDFQQVLDKSHSFGASLFALINCIGTVSFSDQTPMKSLKDINQEDLQYSFSINSIPTLLIAKYFKKEIIKYSSHLVTLSAMVGSISDNRSGGWYAYRTTKAALNMAIKNIHLEINRLKPKSIICAIHPGTTFSKLSKNYLSGIKHEILSPRQTGQNVWNLLSSLKTSDSGKLLHWNGKEIPW
ncbi:MAG: SDR family NAD(P)-dependent oxidoreductase [Bacteriovoracaceae bacterium]|jgi:NAD(P)-dependent dehydrogenase (short-subunit alcohol dehydrogenase family)|nr:SDR family NAD(P)-dependent oxidoreductase [Bacteriovoracaceae bacterium]